LTSVPAAVFDAAFGRRCADVVDLDASGRVVSRKDVMNLREFSIRLGCGHAQMLVPNLVVWVGPSCVVVGRHSQLPLDGHQHADVFWIYLDGNNVVQETAQGFDRPSFFKETERGR
jgi:hypothetical protein